MPIATVAAIAEIVAAAAAVGGTTYGIVEQNQAQQAQAKEISAEEQRAQQQAQQEQQKQQALANAQTQAQQKAAMSRQYPNLQEQLGGSVAPDYYVQQSADQVGAGGQTNVGMDAFRQFLGDKNLMLDPAQGGLTTTASATSPTSSAASGTSYWDNLQQGGQPGLSDQVSGGSV